MPPLWSSKQKEAADRSVTSRNQVDRSATKWCPAKTTSMLLRSSAFSVTEWRSSQRRRADSRHHNIEETNRPRRRTYNTSVFSEFNIVNMHVHLLSCDVLLPARRRLTCKRRVVSKPNFGSQLWKRNGLFLLAPRPKSRRHHINNGWAWFEASAVTARQRGARAHDA